jgi:hypothetical protein
MGVYQSGLGRFYVLSRGQGSVQCPVELACYIALDAPADLVVSFALSAAAGGIGDGAGIAAHAGAGDDVNGPVQCPDAAPVEPVTGDLAAGGLDRTGPGELGEGSFVAAPSGVGGRHDGLGGGDRAYPGTA